MWPQKFFRWPGTMDQSLQLPACPTVPEQRVMISVASESCQRSNEFLAPCKQRNHRCLDSQQIQDRETKTVSKEAAWGIGAIVSSRG